MTREILFRGFHEEENGSTTIYVDGRTVAGHWIKGWLATVSTGISHINVFESYEGNNIRVTTYSVITSTVGEYTDINDKNGKKIFEGDKCRITRTCILANGFIKFKYGRFYFKKNCGETLINLSDLAFNNYKIEVIGTIFDTEVAKCD